MDWQGLLFRDISVCMVVYIIVILPLFIISWIFEKSIGVLENFCDYRLSATIGGQRLSSDYRLLNDFQIVSDYGDYGGNLQNCQQLLQLYLQNLELVPLWRAGWALLAGYCLQRGKGWRLAALIRLWRRLQAGPFCLLMAAVGGTMPETPIKAARSRYTAFLGRGSIRTWAEAKVAQIALKWPLRRFCVFGLCSRSWAALETCLLWPLQWLVSRFGGSGHIQVPGAKENRPASLQGGLY